MPKQSAETGVIGGNGLPPVRIEFCGVPTAGKSTLCTGAIRLLQERGRTVLDRPAMVDAGLRARDFGLLGNRLATWLPRWRGEFLGVPHALNDWHAFVLKHPAFVARIHEWLAEDGTDDVWRSCVFYAVLTSAFEFELSRAAKLPVLLDEGWIQRFFTLRGYRGVGRREDAAAYAASMPLPSALVWVTAQGATCMERVQARGEAPLLLQNEPESTRRVRLEEGNALLGAMADEVERRGVRVLRVNGAGNVDREAASISDFVESFL